MPWTGLQRWKRRDGETHPHRIICAENPTDFFHNETRLAPTYPAAEASPISIRIMHG